MFTPGVNIDVIYEKCNKLVHYVLQIKLLGHESKGAFI